MYRLYVQSGTSHPWELWRRRFRGDGVVAVMYSLLCTQCSRVHNVYMYPCLCTQCSRVHNVYMYPCLCTQCSRVHNVYMYPCLCTQCSPVHNVYMYSCLCTQCSRIHNVYMYSLSVSLTDQDCRVYVLIATQRIGSETNRRLCGEMCGCILYRPYGVCRLCCTDQ